MSLGENLEVAFAVQDLDKTMAFLKNLGFSQYGEVYQEPQRWTILTDGDIYVGLHEYNEPSPMLMYFTNHFAEKTTFIEELGIPLVDKMEKEGKLLMIAFEDPHGQRIGIADLMGMVLETPPVEHGASIGKFGEYSIPTDNLPEAVRFWEQLGFKAEVHDKPYPWALMRDELLTVGLHQTDDFSEITLSYFSSEMGEKIETVRESGIALKWEKANAEGRVVNARIETPDGQPFFLFEYDGEI